MPKTVVVGVSGGIAAYKSAYLTSALVKKGYDVHVIMTKNAQEFVSALTFETISGNAAITDTFERNDEYDVSHVALAKKADMFIVAPATANILGKVAAGIADDMLTTTLMAAKCPVIFAPAMNTAMYEAAATKDSIKVLSTRGFHVMETGVGMLACRDEGAGRMKEPNEIIEYAEKVFESLYDMHGLNVLISAGPTVEDIDPVRFLSNRSSGKMGYAIAEAAVDRGATVTLVSGPVCLDAVKKANMVYVRSAADMHKSMTELAEKSDIIIMCAAVADYTPQETAQFKIKKGEDMTIKLVRTKDILKDIGEIKTSKQILMGFAAETNDFDINAKSKLGSKNLDIIALNNVLKDGEGFGADINNIKLFFKNGNENDLGTGSKKELAKQIVNSVFEYRKKTAR